MVPEIATEQLSGFQREFVRFSAGFIPARSSLGWDAPPDS
jgi:hypothetical protein